VSKKSLIFSSLKMATATFSSRILGLVREQTMAAMFGASGLTDAFTVAYRIPNMLRDLFAEGAFSSAFVPTFMEMKGESFEKARSFLWSMFFVLLAITALISTIVIINAENVIFLMTDEKFVADEKRLALCVTMVQIMAPFLTLVSLSALFMGALNSLKVFFWPAMAPAFFNVVMIGSMILMPGWLITKGHHPILSLALGVLLGGFAQLCVQIPLIIKHGFFPKRKMSLTRDGINSTLNKLGIGTIGIAANQINILITTVLATGTVVGAVSWLTYGFRLFQFPVGVLSVSIAGSNLVHFSDEIKAGNVEAARKILKSSYNLSWLVIIPAMALMFALSDQSVHLVFQRGAFSALDSDQVTAVLKVYLIGLPFYGLFKIFGPTFFSLDKAKVPVLISVTAIICNIIFCLVMVPKYGFTILALGTSLSMMMNCLLQSLFLRRFLSLPLSFFIDLTLVKLSLAGVLCWLFADFFGRSLYHFHHTLFQRIFEFLGVCSLTAIFYILCLAVLGEASGLKKLLRK